MARRRGAAVLECVVNLSEGRDNTVVHAWAQTLGNDVLDVHADAHHHRSVFTLVGTAAPRRLTELAVAALDLRTHEGVHPRLGVVDVVPFVPLVGSSMADALRARDAFARWAATTLDVPCFLYGPTRSLPEVRRAAWTALAPDVGPRLPHPTAGAICVGAREVLVAYNIWLARADLATARRIAARLRGPHVRALGLQVGDAVQVSMNLVAPARFGPQQAYDVVTEQCQTEGAQVERAELVGLIPHSVLRAIPERRWHQLDLAASRTIEARLKAV